MDPIAHLKPHESRCGVLGAPASRRLLFECRLKPTPTCRFFPYLRSVVIVAFDLGLWTEFSEQSFMGYTAHPRRRAHIRAQENVGTAGRPSADFHYSLCGSGARPGDPTTVIFGTEPKGYGRKAYPSFACISILLSYYRDISRF